MEGPQGEGALNMTKCELSNIARAYKSLNRGAPQSAGDPNPPQFAEDPPHSVPPCRYDRMRKSYTLSKPREKWTGEGWEGPMLDAP